MIYILCIWAYNISHEQENQSQKGLSHYPDINMLKVET